MMNTLYRLLLGCAGALLFSVHAYAETVLVVSENSPLHQLSRHEVADLYLGNNKSQSRLGRIVPVDQAKDALRETFYRAYLGKSLSQVQAHWAKIIFTGRGYPPRTVSGAGELKDLLRDNPNALGYMDRSLVGDSLRIVKLN